MEISFFYINILYVFLCLFSSFYKRYIHTFWVLAVLLLYFILSFRLVGLSTDFLNYNNLYKTAHSCNSIIDFISLPLRYEKGYLLIVYYVTHWFYPYDPFTVLISFHSIVSCLLILRIAKTFHLRIDWFFLIYFLIYFLTFEFSIIRFSLSVLLFCNFYTDYYVKKKTWPIFLLLSLATHNASVIIFLVFIYIGIGYSRLSFKIKLLFYCLLLSFTFFISQQFVVLAGYEGYIGKGHFPYRALAELLLVIIIDFILWSGISKRKIPHYRTALFLSIFICISNIILYEYVFMAKIRTFAILIYFISMLKEMLFIKSKKIKVKIFFLIITYGFLILAVNLNGNAKIAQHSMFPYSFYGNKESTRHIISFFENITGFK